MEEKVIVTKSKLTAIGDNIRSQTNTTKQYTLDEMANMKLGGSDTSDATATADDIRLGKTAYVNDIKIAGTIEDYDGEQEGGIDNTQEDRLIDGTLTSYSNSRVTGVRNYAFYYYTNLTSIDLPLVTTIGGSAFYDCRALTSVNIPLVTSIGGSAFYDCRALTSVNIPLVTSIDTKTFYGCRALTSVNIPLVTTIQQYAFSSCSNLTSVNIPLVTTIQQHAFSSCIKLVTIKLPNVSSLNGQVFYNCYILKNIVITQSNKVCTLSSSNPFANCYHILGETHSVHNPEGLKDGYIYVPDSLVDSYKSATNWSTYADQIKPLSELPQEYNTNQEE